MPFPRNSLYKDGLELGRVRRMVLLGQMIDGGGRKASDSPVSSGQGGSDTGSHEGEDCAGRIK